MTSRLLIWTTVTSVVVIAAAPSEAETQQASRNPIVDATLMAAIGGSCPGRKGALLAVRLRRPETLLALEVSVYVPWGVGANVLLDVYRNERLRVHLIDPGVFRSWGSSSRIVRPDVGRAIDLTLGLGVEWQFADRWWFTLDCRFFFPDLMRVIGYYGDYARRIYAQAAEEVQTWAGIAYSF